MKIEELIAKAGAEGDSSIDKGGVFAELLPPQFVQTMIRPNNQTMTMFFLCNDTVASRYLPSPMFANADDGVCDGGHESRAHCFP